jgi:signal transduction histidine kinase
LEQDGLVKTLQNRLDAVEKRSGISVDFQADVKTKLPVLVEEGLFYIASEALNNSLKHAMASSLTIKLISDEVEAGLEIQDNGCGFDVNALGNEGGFGLSNMRERTEKLGGMIQVESMDGEGTKISVKIPFA